MTIDRIVFLRICEDRGIEQADQLQDILAGEGVYTRLCQLFRQADARYNSGLFHFAEEKGESSSPDDLTLRLAIDDKVLKEIISALYYPGPYVFKEIPADILGQVYERFLGKVIRLTPGHQARVEEKPEVRKAGGVYYTPTYIVDYIVKNTVGRLLEGKTPREAAGLKILDPACGSGSFLLGAYQYLLDWHTRWYSEHDPQTWAKARTPAIYQAQGGDWRLTTSEKKRILLNNLHGVDIDPQAVEVTKLSLSLKVLEGESQESIGTQLGLFKERALPDLGSNIKCGNSLIGPDYYEGRQLSMDFMDEEEHYRVNAFNWKAAFPRIFTAGGFDAVIGNPPYIDSEWLTKTNPELREYCNSRYQSAKGNWDIFCIFIEKALNLCKKSGLSSMIVPNKLFSSDYAQALRAFLSSSNSLMLFKLQK
jgi:type I restriction-modification system DNA methylase subunit